MIDFVLHAVLDLLCSGNSLKQQSTERYVAPCLTINCHMSLCIGVFFSNCYALECNAYKDITYLYSLQCSATDNMCWAYDTTAIQNTPHYLMTSHRSSSMLFVNVNHTRITIQKFSAGTLWVFLSILINMSYVYKPMQLLYCQVQFLILVL
jgi:hypothetical protein